MGEISLSKGIHKRSFRVGKILQDETEFERLQDAGEAACLLLLTFDMLGGAARWLRACSPLGCL